MSKKSSPNILKQDEEGGLGGSRETKSQDFVLFGKSWLCVSVGRSETVECDSPRTWVEAQLCQAIYTSVLMGMIFQKQNL